MAQEVEGSRVGDELSSQLHLVQEVRIETGKLQEIQERIAAKQRAVQDENMLLDELRKEKGELEKEQEHFMRLLQEVRIGLADTVKCLKDTAGARDVAQAELSSLMDEQYTPQKDTVDKMRAELGLEPLPSLQEVQEKKLASYLEKRRKSWREAEEQQLVGQPVEKRQKLPAPPDTNAAPAVKRKRGRPKGSGKGKAKAPVAKKPTGRKRGRPRKVVKEADESEEWTPP